MEKTIFCSGLFLFLWYHLLIVDVAGLMLGAFNIKTFGPSKSSNDKVMGTLAKIAVRYDILLVQEIKDAKQQAIYKLTDRILSDHGVDMKIIISNRLGRTRYKEQYAFLYREDRGISVLTSDHFEDGDESSGDDLFEREPFMVKFQAFNTVIRDFSLIAIHATTSKTVEELVHLEAVVTHVRDTWNTRDILILGDLNADCAYVPKRDWPRIRLRGDSSVLWPITDDMDTTVKASTDCAYDRFVVSGSKLQGAIKPGSARVFNFQDFYQMTEAEALEVSDHFPIELELEDKTVIDAQGGWSSEGNKDGNKASANRDDNYSSKGAKNFGVKEAIGVIRKFFKRIYSSLQGGERKVEL